MLSHASATAVGWMGIGQSIALPPQAEKERRANLPPKGKGRGGPPVRQAVQAVESAGGVDEPAPEDDGWGFAMGSLTIAPWQTAGPIPTTTFNRYARLSEEEMDADVGL